MSAQSKWSRMGSSAPRSVSLCGVPPLCVPARTTQPEYVGKSAASKAERFGGLMFTVTVTVAPGETEMREAREKVTVARAAVMMGGLLEGRTLLLCGRVRI